MAPLLQNAFGLPTNGRALRTTPFSGEERNSSCILSAHSTVHTVHPPRALGIPPASLRLPGKSQHLLWQGCMAGRSPQASSMRKVTRAAAGKGWISSLNEDEDSDSEDDDDWHDISFESQRPKDRPSRRLGLTELDLNRWRQQATEEKYRMQVERSISEDRKQDLGVHHWSTWSSPGPCAYEWEWRADEQVYIVKGALKVTPMGSESCAEFKAGDFVRFPKWMYAELEIVGSYEQKYRFRAYGDDN